MPTIAPHQLVLAIVLFAFQYAPTFGNDPIREIQNAYVANRAAKISRAYHFGSQGAGNTFSNHTSHSNRLIPVYVFGKKADLGAVTGRNSAYRDAEKVRALYGRLPENTVNPEAEYCDQSDLFQVQSRAAESGAKYIFTVWFDGMDWETTRAAAIARTGAVYTQGKGSGLIFQDYSADGSAQFGFCVTSPTHDKNEADVDAQSVAIPTTSLGGGYDARIAGPNRGRSATSRPLATSRDRRRPRRSGKGCCASAASCTLIPTARRARGNTLRG